MQDVSIRLRDISGSLAAIGEALALKGVSIEGGGAWTLHGQGVAHFMFIDGDAARLALEEAGLQVLAVNDTVMLRLAQDQPGQLGKLCRAMADAGVNIEVLYSDHVGNLVLVVDDMLTAGAVAEGWSQKL